MKRTKRFVVVIMTTVMMFSAAFGVEASTYSLTKSCPACGQINMHQSYTNNFHCWKCNKDCRLYTYVCTKCGAVYKICANGDLQ